MSKSMPTLAAQSLLYFSVQPLLLSQRINHIKNEAAGEYDSDNKMLQF